MPYPLLFAGSQSPGISHACRYLKKHGYQFTDHPTPEITHLIFDVPAKSISADVLERAPEKAVIIGGFLDHSVVRNRQVFNLLKDEEFLARNAAITAQCAVRLGCERLNSCCIGLNVLILGWGRIGKHLAPTLKYLGANVTIAARKSTDIALAHSMGLAAVELQEAPKIVDSQDIVYNTIPHPILNVDNIPGDYTAIELASKPGITGAKVIQAKGLPGKMAPQCCGELIGQRIHALLKENGK